MTDACHRDQEHARLFQKLDSVSKLVVAVVVVTAAELTIHWNGIGNVNSLSSAGQTIPFVIGLAAIIRILYVRYVKRLTSSVAEYRLPNSSHSSSRSPVRPGDPQSPPAPLMQVRPRMNHQH